MKTTVSVMKATLDGIHGRSDTAEEKMSDPEGAAIGMIQDGTQREKTTNRSEACCLIHA